VLGPILSPDWERVEREQRDLSRKEHDTCSWEIQRQTVAEAPERMWNEKPEFKHELVAFYTPKYVVAVKTST
jgi:putative transposase